MLETVWFFKETREIMKALDEIGSPATAEQVAAKTRYPIDNVQLHLEDLYSSKFVEKENVKGVATYSLSQAAKSLVHFPLTR